MEATLAHYNNNKDPDEIDLEELDRKEGGFQIQLAEDQWKKNYAGFIDANDKIRQVRWHEGLLISRGFRTFTGKQYMLLYEALVVGFGGGNVILE
jgi:hypothetical protein